MTGPDHLADAERREMDQLTAEADAAAAVIGIEYDPSGAAWLAKLAGGEGPVSCACGDTAGPFDPEAMVCEGCQPTGGAA